MNKNIVYIILLLIGIFSLSSFSQKKQGRTAPREITVLEGLTYDILQYRKGEHIRAGQMAISYKDDGIKNKPVILFIHGGGWTKGDKDAVTHQVFKAAQKGFVGVSISYRLIQEAPFPACIEDVKQAIRYLKSLESELPIDTERIGVWGYSAGAHLALMIALTPEDEFKTDEYADYTASIKTVMAVSAPTDFVARLKNRGSLTQFSNYQNIDEQFQQSVSPVTYVHKNQIPVFMLHGTEDPIVMPYHYENFKEQCETAGVKNFKLYEFEDAGHMFYFKQKKDVNPIFQEFLNSI